jgi:acetyl esterase/lipase
MWLGPKNLGDPVCRELSDVAAAVVLELSGRDVAGGAGHDLAVLGWAAEHAREFGADDAHVLVAGGARAARLALVARDAGWPVLRRQLLVHPAFTARQPMPSNVAGASPATVVCSPRQDGGQRYAARLRAAGVEVREVRDACRG